MFSGGGVAWAEAALKRGEFAVRPASPGTRPDLTGLSCRFQEIKATHGLILSLLALPRLGADPADFHALTENIVMLVEQSPDAGRPVPAGGPGMRWPPPGAELEVRTAKGDRRFRRVAVLAKTFISFLIMHFGIRIGNFVPATYLRQVVENSDFRKYDDGLRMVIDCTADLAEALDRRLEAASKIANYGLHRQEAAIMTCFISGTCRSRSFHRRRPGRLHGIRDCTQSVTQGDVLIRCHSHVVVKEMLS
jgi:hypothetical protein